MVVVVVGIVVVDTNRVPAGPTKVVPPLLNVDATDNVVGVPGLVVPVTLVDDTGTELAVDLGVVTSVVLWGTVVREICAGAPASAPAHGTASITPNAPAAMRRALDATTPIRLVTRPSLTDRTELIPAAAPGSRPGTTGRDRRAAASFPGWRQ